jgi:hypothetical protein
MVPSNRAPYVELRSAGFQTCCIADFQIGSPHDVVRVAGLETGDTSDLEVCATGTPRACFLRGSVFALLHLAAVNGVAAQELFDAQQLIVFGDAIGAA